MQKIALIISVILFFSATQCKKTIAPKKDFDLKTPAYFGKQYQIPATNPMSKAGIELGRMLFYDVRLSKNDSISCGTCHQQKLAFTDGNSTAIGMHGKRLERNTMSLVNLLWSKDFFWDGRAKSLEEQVIFPIIDSLEMNMDRAALERKLQNIALYPPLFQKAFDTPQISAENIIKAIAQFERTLISSNSRYDKIVSGEADATESELRAINLFMTHPIPEANIRGGNCGDCHGSHLTTLNTFHQNGLDKKPKDAGLGKFTGNPFDKGKMKAPSLRNIALTAPYMHDGRFNTLEEVLDHYNEHIQVSETLDPLIMEATNQINGKSLLLTEAEKQDIMLFLQMLTDSSFVNDKRFSNPFLENK